MFDDVSEELSDPLSGAVKSLFGLSYLFPYQRLVMTNILEAAHAAGIPVNWPAREGGEAQPEIEGEADDSEGETDRECSGRQIVILPTGAGKSLCFQLPAMLIEGLTLVIYPILSLMADQERRLRERGFSPVIIRGGQSKEERDEIWQNLKSGQGRFIIANPEVLLTAQVKERGRNRQGMFGEADCHSPDRGGEIPLFPTAGNVDRWVDPCYLSNPVVDGGSGAPAA